MPGNEAEFYIPTQPGKIFKATVDSVIWAQAQGQVDANGNLPNTGVIPVMTAATTSGFTMVRVSSKLYYIIPKG